MGSHWDVVKNDVLFQDQYSAFCPKWDQYRDLAKSGIGKINIVPLVQNMINIGM